MTKISVEVDKKQSRLIKKDLKLLSVEMGVFRQIYSTFIISAMCMNLGIMFGWPSSRINLFSSTNTTLNRVMTETEISLFGSLSCVAALLSTPLSGVLLDLLGRKNICVLFSLPLVIAWTLVIFVPRVEAILLAVFLSGLAGCSFMVVPIFISELSQENIRGILTSCSNIFSGIGIMVSYILGGYLSYDMMNYVCLTISITSLVSLSLVKETPVHLKKKGLDKEAVESICFYRSAKPNSKIVLLEMEKLKRILNPLIDEATPEEEALKSEESLKPKRLSKFQFIKQSKSTQRGLVISTLLLSFSVFQGIVVVQVYAEPLFQETLPNVSANFASIIFGSVTIVSGFTGAFLIDYFGRRPIMIYPSLVATVTSAALGSQLQFNWGPTWLTALLIFLYSVLVACSTNVVPFVMPSELFLPEIRGIMTMLAIEWGWLLNFLTLFIFNPLVVAVGMGPLFYIFSFVSLLTTIYSVLYVPETKGLSVDVIQTVVLKGMQY